MKIRTPGPLRIAPNAEAKAEAQVGSSSTAQATTAPLATLASTGPVDELDARKPTPDRPALSPDEAKASLQTVLDVLGRAAQQENATWALRRVAGAGGDVGQAAEALLARGTADLALPTGVEALAGALAGELARLSGKDLQSEAKRALVDELTIFRYGKRLELGFSLEKVALPDDLPAPRHLTARKGLDPAVAGLRLAGEHSMHDVGAYVAERLGGFVVDDLVKNDRTIELHQGSTEDAFASLAARGFTEIVRVHGPKSATYNQIHLAQNPSTGELRYAVTNNWGMDRLAHLEKLVSFASVEGPKGPRRIHSEQVQVFADALTHPEQIYRHYSRALLASGTVPADVVVGFKSGILRELGGRAVAARQLAFLQEALGPDPVKTLKARAAGAPGGAALLAALDKLGDAAGVLALPPAEVFKFQKNINQLRAVEAALTGLARADPAAADLVADVVGEKGFKLTVRGHVAERVPEGEFLDQSVITVVGEDQVAKSLLVTRNPYGDLAHQMGRVLVDNGVENIFVVGTAGGLAKDGKVGDVHVPGRLRGANGEELPFENHAIPVVMHKDRRKELKDFVKVGTTLGEVDSPLDETRAWVDRMKAGDYDVVEMELADLVRATAGSSTKVSGMYVVSDLPGTDQTLEKQSGEHAREGLALVSDVLIEQLGIRDVVLVGDARPPMKEGFAGAEVLADRILKARGLDDADHVVMRYNLSRYLYNGLSDAALVALQADLSRDVLAAPQLSSRWKAKIDRALQKPFTNQQVIEHLQTLGHTLKGAVDLAKANADGFDYSFHVLGSIVKGRAGAGSDVDILIKTDNAAMKETLADSPWGYRGAKPGQLVVVGTYEYAMSRGDHYGPVIDVGKADGLLGGKDLLVELYAKAVAEHGIEVTQGKDGAWTVKHDPAKATGAPERETEAVAEKVLEYEKAYRKWMNSDFILRHLKDSAPLADVEHLPFERLVAQGEAALQARLTSSLSAESVALYLDQPEGQLLLGSERGKAFLEAARLPDESALRRHLATKGLAGLPLDRLVDGEMASALMGLSDPLEALAVDLAGAERARKAKDAGQTPGTHVVFFADEVKRAQARGAAPASSKNPLLALVGNRSKKTARAELAKATAAAEPALFETFFDQHVSKGTGTKDVGAAHIVYGKDGVGRVDVLGLAKHDPLLFEIASFAQEHGVTVGFWGGSARDLLVGRTRDKTSDVDLVYDASEPAFDGFKDKLIDHLKTRFDELPEIDFSVDKSPDARMRGPYRGLTIEKLGLMADGRVFDFTARGLDDLKAGVLHYNSSDPFEPPGISTLFRMAGAQIQNPGMKLDDETLAVVRQVSTEFYGPGTDSERDLKAFRAATKDMGRREVGRYLKAERERLGGKVPGENLVDFFRTLGKIVKGGVATDPAWSLGVLEEFGLADFLRRIGADDELQPLREAAGQ